MSDLMDFDIDDSDHDNTRRETIYDHVETRGCLSIQDAQDWVDPRFHSSTSTGCVTGDHPPRSSAMRSCFSARRSINYP